MIGGQYIIILARIIIVYIDSKNIDLLYNFDYQMDDRNPNEFSGNPYEQQITANNLQQNTYHQHYEGVRNPADMSSNLVPTYNTP